MGNVIINFKFNPTTFYLKLKTQSIRQSPTNSNFNKFEEKTTFNIHRDKSSEFNLILMKKNSKFN